MAGAQKTRQLERQRVGIGDVATGVRQRDRALRAHAVEVMPVAASLAEIDRVKAPADQRLGRTAQMRLGLAQPLDHRVDRAGARPDAAIRIAAIMKAAIDIAPVDALGDMAVAFDETRQDHLVAEALIEIEAAPSLEFIECAGAQDAAIAHRDMGGVGAGRIHGDDAAGGVDDRHGSGAFAEGLAGVKTERGDGSVCRLGRGWLKRPCRPAAPQWPARRIRSRPVPRRCVRPAGQSADRGRRCRAPS